MQPIVLSHELEQAIEDRAQQQKTTPELLVLDGLTKLFLPTTAVSVDERKTMADFFEGYIGGLHSSEIVPGGANLSENTGRQFSEMLMKKHREGQESC